MELEVIAGQIQQLLNYGECRCCASRGYHKELLKEYFDNGDREVYAEMFMECFTICFDTTALSQLICSSCVQRLREASSFRDMVLLTESRLRDPLRRTGSDILRDLEDGATLIKSEYLKVEYEGDGCDMDTFDNCFVTDHIDIQECDLMKPEESPEDQSDQDLVPGEWTLLQRFDPSTLSLPSAPPELFTHYLKQFDGKTVTARDVERIMHETDEMSANYDQHRFTEKKGLILNIINILKYSNVTPFRSKTAVGYPCYYCRKPMQKLDEMRRHIEEKHRDDREDASKSLFWKYGPESIIINVDITDLQCNLCHTDMNSLPELKKHLSEVHKILMSWAFTDRVIPYKLAGCTYECQMCGCNFETFGAVERHMNNHFRNYICNTCGNGFVTKTRLKVHQKTHSGKGPGRVCELCSKSYSTDQKLKNHVDAVHKLLKRFKCSRCPERFTEYFSRQKHMVDAHGATPIKYKCNCCDKAFDRRFDLTRHLKKDHLKEKNNECEYCGYRSYALSEMRVHMIKHVGERTHECPVCKKAYARKKTLTEHMKIHNNDRRHACEVCRQTFIQKCSLKGHIKTHHPELNVD